MTDTWNPINEAREVGLLNWKTYTVELRRTLKYRDGRQGLMLSVSTTPSYLENITVSAVLLQGEFF